MILLNLGELLNSTSNFKNSNLEFHQDHESQSASLLNCSQNASSRQDHGTIEIPTLMSGEVRNMSGQVRNMSGHVRNTSGQVSNMSDQVSSREHVRSSKEHVRSRMEHVRSSKEHFRSSLRHIMSSLKMSGQVGTREHVR